MAKAAAMSRYIPPLLIGFDSTLDVGLRAWGPKSTVEEGCTVPDSSELPNLLQFLCRSDYELVPDDAGSEVVADDEAEFWCRA
jgi:hypothetical protein